MGRTEREKECEGGNVCVEGWIFFFFLNFIIGILEASMKRIGRETARGWLGIKEIHRKRETLFWIIANNGTDEKHWHLSDTLE